MNTSTPPAPPQAPPQAPGTTWRDINNNSGVIPVIKNNVLTRYVDDAARRADAAAADAARRADAAARIRGGKKTKKRAFRRKRTRRARNRTSKKSYKKSKKLYKGKRGGATDPITFNIVKCNSDDTLFEVELNPDQTGKDLYDRVNEQLDQNPGMLTADEKVGERKLLTDNDVIVKYDDNLSMFQPRTKLILSIIGEGSCTSHGRGQAPAAGPPQDDA